MLYDFIIFEFKNIHNSKEEIEKRSYSRDGQKIDWLGVSLTKTHPTFSNCKYPMAWKSTLDFGHNLSTPPAVWSTLNQFFVHLNLRLGEE
jgi:hypothetical protein